MIVVRWIIIKAKDLLETSKMTAQLINEAFNLENTGLRGSSLRERMKSFRAEWIVFFNLLTKYSKNKSHFNFCKVKARLNRETAFAALKRDYIRQHQSEFSEFQKYVDEE